MVRHRQEGRAAGQAGLTFTSMTAGVHLQSSFASKPEKGKFSATAAGDQWHCKGRRISPRWYYAKAGNGS